MADSPVTEFYRDRCIFVTGATGFVGKVLIEKLLRSCRGIDQIYLLIRPKTNVNVHYRLQELIKTRQVITV
jgi:fatty acyl-CoA reductase